MILPMSMWRPYLGLLLGFGRDATEAEVHEYIRRENARNYPGYSANDRKIGDIERDNSEAIAQWWKS